GRGRTRRGRLRRRCPVALPRRRSGLTATAVVGHGRRDRGRGERRGGRRRAGGERAEPFARLAHGGPFVRVGPQQAHEQRGGLPGVLRRVDLPVGRRVEQGELVGVVAVRRQALDRVVQRRTQGEHVGGGRRVGSAREFRREVGGRAADQPRLREGEVAAGTGDAEVGD